MKQRENVRKGLNEVDVHDRSKESCLQRLIWQMNDATVV